MKIKILKKSSRKMREILRRSQRSQQKIKPRIHELKTNTRAFVAIKINLQMKKSNIKPNNPANWKVSFQFATKNFIIPIKT